MIEIMFDKLKDSPGITGAIRWDVNPGIFMNPSSGPSKEPVDIVHGYMLYVEPIQDKPALVIMQLKPRISKTVGYVFDIPDNMLNEAMECVSADCVSGMYPLSERLTEWLKKEFNRA